MSHAHTRRQEGAVSEAAAVVWAPSFLYLRVPTLQLWISNRPLPERRREGERHTCVYTMQNFPRGKDERGNKYPTQGFKKATTFQISLHGRKKSSFHEKFKQIQVFFKVISLSFMSKLIGRKLKIVSIAVLLGKAFPVNKHYLT